MGSGAGRRSLFSWVFLHWFFVGGLRRTPLLTSPHFAGGGILLPPREMGEGWGGGGRREHVTRTKKAPLREGGGLFGKSEAYGRPSIPLRTMPGCSTPYAGATRS